MKFLGFEVKESLAVPPGTILICDQMEFNRFLAKAEADIIDRLWSTGLLASIERDDASLRTIEDGAYTK